MCIPSKKRPKHKPTIKIKVLVLTLKQMTCNYSHTYYLVTCVEICKLCMGACVCQKKNVFLSPNGFSQTSCLFYARGYM